MNSNYDVKFNFDKAEIKVTDPAGLKRKIRPSRRGYLPDMRDASIAKSPHPNGQVKLTVDGITEDWDIQFSMWVQGSPWVLLLTRVDIVELDSSRITNLHVTILVWENPNTLGYNEPTVSSIVGKSVTPADAFYFQANGHRREGSPIWHEIAMTMLSMKLAD